MRSVGGRLAASVVLLGLLLPLAGASSSGDLTTEGAVSFDGPSEGDYHASAFYLSDASALSSLSVVGRARVCHHEWTLQEVQVQPVSSNPLYRQPTDKTGGCFDTDALTLSLGPGTMSGWLGGRFTGASTFVFSGAGPVVVQPSATSTMASPQASYATTDPTPDTYDEPWFFERTVGPHLNVSSAGTVRYHGEGEIKFMGLSVMVKTPTNSTNYQTGDTAGSGPLHPREWRWITVDYVGDLVLASPRAALEVQASSAALSWEGVARFVAKSGTLTLEGRAYSLTAGEPATLEGRFSADVKPEGSDGAALRLGLTGEAQNAALGSVRVATVPGGPVFPWAAAVGVAVAAVVVGGATVAILRRRGILRPSRVKRAEALAEDARREAGADNHPRALALIREAVELLPSGKYHHDEGVILLALGEPREALEAFEKAARWLVEGEAEMHAAECALLLEEPDDAARWLVRALDRPDLSPRILSMIAAKDEAAAEPSFTPLLMRPDVEAALERAKARRPPEGWSL